jgi:hypothetical protein
MKKQVGRRAVIAASIATAGVTIAGKLAQAETKAPPVPPADMVRHEKYMRLAIEQANAIRDGLSDPEVARYV